MGDLPARDRYKLLVSTVVPRPIAWVTTMSPAGTVNAAPYSFFNAMGDDPPLLVLGLMKDGATGDDKDTATNILATGEFVVNLVGEPDAAAMVRSAAPVPRVLSEIDYAGIATAPALRVAPPRIASAPVSFECVRRETVTIGTGQVIVIGEVLVTHVADAFVTDPKRLHLDTTAMHLIARMHGADRYLRTTDQFALPREPYDPARLEGSETPPAA
ncbi:flavin reductase family protein [Novosphingobium piscinae]|uniref:Flavin reductase family protein n=2 Tax=Novosphingobium piscinae TaxID=1507448 RepID=A0A7X1FXC8_9SPHN|nr:flavin reductase family protein [Novosphingobium piscinae]MBC2668619.1 flavin reductase family protein [Novosphingobium piscinae]